MAEKKDEITVLLEEVEQNKDVIFARFKGHHTNKEKQNIWENIATKLTEPGGLKDQARRSARSGRILQVWQKGRGHCRGLQLKKQVVGPMSPPFSQQRKRRPCQYLAQVLQMELVVVLTSLEE